MGSGGVEGWEQEDSHCGPLPKAPHSPSATAQEVANPKHAHVMKDRLVNWGMG